ILEEAVDNLLAKIGDDKKLLKWLQEYSKEKIEDNFSQRIDDDIKVLGGELFKENFQIFFPENSESVYSRENLDSFSKELNIIKTQFETILKEKGKRAVESIQSNGFSIDDFSYKKTGVAGYFLSLQEGITKEPGARVLSASQDVEKWVAKKHIQAAEIYQLVESELQPLLFEIIALFENSGQHYFTAVAVLKQIRMLGILTDLKEEIKMLLHEKGVLQISDSNLLLSKIIGRSDSPFIYEKTGNQFNHYMLDEFQDTSTLQWNNFKPLIGNSLAEGRKNLVVGDVKQSIYRWRNSDWKILSEQINQDFSAEQTQHFSLEHNWRSDKNIIDFNNAVFESIKEIFENTLLKEIDTADDVYVNKFRNVYDSFIQKPGKTDAPGTGFVSVQFLPDDEFFDTSTELLVEQVKQLQDRGIHASEIAILIRRNSEGTGIIEAFLNAANQPENKSYNLSVLSNESLFLHASKGVLFVMYTIELLIDRENEITKVALLNLWMDWLKPELQKRGKYIKNSYNQTQLDFADDGAKRFDEEFAKRFEIELSNNIQVIQQKILLTSLDETITQICSQFGLFNIESELPFVQTLIDKSGELKTSLSNDLSNLLFWWNEKGYKTSVNVNEELDSIRLLTVHKSKGLEFKAVLLPYLNWGTSWSGNMAPIMWCQPEIAPFNRFPLLPVRAGATMEKSYFKDIYYEEKVNYMIDSFNLAYVAFTRAKSVLMINCPAPNQNSRTSGKSMHHILQKSLASISGNGQFSGCLIDEQSTFTYGAIPNYLDKNKESGSAIIWNYQFNDFSEKLKLRRSGDNFLVEGEKNKSIKNTGKIIHDILSEIETSADIEKACFKALQNGLISESELKEIQNKLQQSISKPEVSPWFDGSYNVLNERSLLTKERLLRPDRIMITANETIVVDYKTGEKKSDNYNWQVKRYAKTLKETGAKKVSGFLWYINLDEVEKVCEL
ncbi:UvrD-helicase domain-containing protein, partial [Draconibacterium sp.]|nr:UvrD-helicase domain-containing protein [Draconibacterium sp.]